MKGGLVQKLPQLIFKEISDTYALCLVAETLNI
jgi:hypothetical protein